MTKNTDIDPSNALFDQIEKMAAERSANIRHARSDRTLRLSFADGQQIVINFDARSHKVWLASQAGSSEFQLLNGEWRNTQDHSELFSKVGSLVEHIFLSNPINANTSAHPVRQAPTITYEVEENKSHMLRNVLVVTLSILLGVWAAQRWMQPQGLNTTAPNYVANNAAATSSCENVLPANGSVSFFAQNSLRADNPSDPEITLKNDHAYPLLLIITQPKTTIPIMSIFVYARQIASLHLPAGEYDLMFGTGHTWCNSHRGFSDGHLMKLEKSLTVQMGKPIQLAMQSSGVKAEDFQLFIHNAAKDISIPKPVFSGDGSMVVQRQPNGHFFLPGTIADVPVNFMVDTGATVTSISSDIARQAGVFDCHETQFQTANGAATGCIVLIPRMTVGNFVVENITVAVMPNLDTNLLGSNILRNFQVRQDGNSMLIGRH
jgi:iron donor protein CyaY